MGGDRQSWNFTAANGMFTLPKDGSCLAAAVNSTAVIRQSGSDCSTTDPQPRQQWVLKPTVHGQLVALSSNTSLCLTEGPTAGQVLSGPASDGSQREMPAAETWGWCVNTSNMWLVCGVGCLFLPFDPRVLPHR